MSSRWIALLCAGAALAAGQERSTSGVSSRLVELSVVALDRKGVPVKDRRWEPFTVLDDGRLREIAVFRYEGGPAGSARQAAAPDVYSNRVEFTGGPPRNVTAIVLDTADTEPGDLMMVTAQAVQYLRSLAPRTRVAAHHQGREPASAARQVPGGGGGTAHPRPQERGVDQRRHRDILGTPSTMVTAASRQQRTVNATAGGDFEKSASRRGGWRRWAWCCARWTRADW
jgi:hypothetical protein